MPISAWEQWRCKANTAGNLQPKIGVSTAANMMKKSVMHLVWQVNTPSCLAASVLESVGEKSSYLSTFPLQAGAPYEHLQICLSRKSTLNGDVWCVLIQKSRQTNIVNAPRESQRCRNTRTRRSQLCLTPTHTKSHVYYLLHPLSGLSSAHLSRSQFLMNSPCERWRQ